MVESVRQSTAVAPVSSDDLSVAYELDREGDPPEVGALRDMLRQYRRDPDLRRGICHQIDGYLKAK